MKRLLKAPLVVILVAACSSTPAVIPTRNLESPSDMTFVCLKTAADNTVSGQSMSECHGRNIFEPSATVNGQRVLGTFAFITNPGRNEIAVADMDRGRLLDLAPLTPGYGMLPAGNDPEVIAASPDGCWVVTANHASCDFTMVDPARLLAGTFTSGSTVASPVTGAGDVSRKIAVRRASGSTLAASIGEIAFLPAPDAGTSCGPTATTTPHAVATFPGCDMVALLDFSFAAGSATIVDAYYVRPDGLVAAGADPICPAECDLGGVDAGGPSESGVDASTSAIDGGLSPTADGGSAASYLNALALVPDGSRVYVGSLTGDSVTSLDLSFDTGFANPSRVKLAENPGGIRRLRFNVDPYATVGTIEGKFLDDRGKFLYAFTNDDSVRVINIDGQPVECDVNLVLDSTDQRPCHPIGEPGFHRRPLAQGPGLRVPVLSNPDSTPPVPRDITFAEIRPVNGADTYYQSLSGQFGFLLASSGQVYVVNLAPQPALADSTASLGTTSPSMATHSFRESRDLGKSGITTIALSVVPQHSIIGTDQAFPTTENYSASDGPLIQPFSNDTPRSYLDFPDLYAPVSPVWNVTWEGPLPNASRTTGLVVGKSDSLAGVLNDSGADFCASGVQVGDILMFSGCTQDTDCQPDDQFTCQVTVSGGPRLCLPRDSAAAAEVVNNTSCAQFLGSRVRYEVAAVTATSLQLQLKLDEVPKTTLNPCQQNSDCWPDIDHGKGGTDSPDGGISKKFECLAVREGETHRCVKRCEHDSDCRAGNVCGDLAGSSVGKLCVEAPPIYEACFPQARTVGTLRPTVAYSVRAGHAFTVSGSLMPSLSPFKRTSSAAAASCAAQPLADPSLVARIPLSAPRCPDAFIAQASSANGPYVQQLSAQPGSNPCLYSGATPHDDATASSTNPDLATNVRAFFQNPQIRFVLSNLNQYAGYLLSIHFELQYGYSPLTAYIPSYEVLLTMGTRIIAGPTQTPESPLWSNLANLISYPYIYVVDQGKTALTAGSHGQVLRVNPRSGSTQIVSFDNTLSGSTPFQIQ